MKLLNSNRFLPKIMSLHFYLGFGFLSSVYTINNKFSNHKVLLCNWDVVYLVALVGVTPTEHAVRQDGSVWRDRILGLLQDPELAEHKAGQLRMALRRSEPTKESHDNVVCNCLGKQWRCTCPLLAQCHVVVENAGLTLHQCWLLRSK